MFYFVSQILSISEPYNTGFNFYFLIAKMRLNIIAIFWWGCQMISCCSRLPDDIALLCQCSCINFVDKIILNLKSSRLVARMNFVKITHHNQKYFFMWGDILPPCLSPPLVVVAAHRRSYIYFLKLPCTPSATFIWMLLSYWAIDKSFLDGDLNPP